MFRVRYLPAQRKDFPMFNFFEIMIGVLGDAVRVWLVSITLMFVSTVMGRLAGTFSAMQIGSLIGSLLVIGFTALMIGALFADTGISIFVGSLTAALMVAAFIVGAAFAPMRRVQTPSSKHVGPWEAATGRFKAADDYHQPLPGHYNPVGSTLDTRA